MFFNVKAQPDVIATIGALVDEDCYEVTAEARLATGDIFDLETGKKIARAKAESMAYRKLWGCLSRLSNRMLNVLDCIEEFGYKAESVVNHNDEYLATF